MTLFVHEVHLLHGCKLFSDNCTLISTLAGTSYCAVALEIEDSYTSSST